MKNKVLAFILTLTLVFTGCSTAWLSTFDQYLQIAGPVLIQILDLIGLAKGDPPNAQLIAKINADSAALKELASSVQSAASQNVVGTCAEFNLAVTTFAGDLAAVEQLANVGNSKTQAEISAGVSIAQEAFQEIETPIASCAAAPSSAAAMAALKAGAAQAKSPEEVVKAFNAVVDKQHHVHLHGKFMRAVSFGHLQ